MKHIDIAKSMLGVTEIKGSKHHPEILQMWRDIKRGGIKDDETPWCAAFVGACLERAGIKSSRFESAKSYLDWGEKLNAPAVGCVVVFTRTGGGHVGFVMGQDDEGNLQVLGGNQKDMVKIAGFGRNRVDGADTGNVVGYRWSPEFGTPDFNLPVLASAQVSTSEA